MVSELAREDIERLAADGIRLTVDEIVRLNALGLKCEAGMDAYDICALPRVAFLGDIVLREPTLGHEAWLDDVRRFVDFEDRDTFLAVHAFAYSRSADALPRLDVPFVKSVLKVVVKSAMKAFKPFTRRQIDRALLYVVRGRDPGALEIPAQDCSKAVERISYDISVGVGVMLNGVAVSLGISFADANRMTRSQMIAVTDRALGLSGLLEDEKSVSARRETEYFRTLDAIKKAHEKDVKNG